MRIGYDGGCGKNLKHGMQGLNSQGELVSETNKELAKASFAYQRKRTGGLQKLLAGTLPRQLLRRGRRLLMLPMDGVGFLLGRRGELVPPRYLNFVGDGNFAAVGDEFLKHFVELGGLSPAERDRKNVV